MEMFLNIFAGLIVLAGLNVYTLKFATKKWDEREYFHSFSEKWNKIALGSSVLTVIVAGLVALQNIMPLTVYMFVPFVALVYVFLFSAWTDFKSGYAPSELAWAGILTSLPFMVWGIIMSGENTLYALASVVLWGLVCFLLYFNRGLGDADVRLLWLVNVATIWWVGLYWSVILFTVACMIQIVVHVFAQIFGWGRLVEVKYNKREMSYRKFVGKFVKSIDLSKESRSRRHVPFIPVLTLSWVVGLTLLIFFMSEQVSVVMFGLTSLI